MLNTLRSELLCATRYCLRSPGFTLSAIFTIGLGIGVTTAVYSLMDGVLLRPFPLPHAEQLVSVNTVEHQRDGKSSPENTSWPDYYDWQSKNHTFSELAALAGDARLVTRADATGGTVVDLNRVSASYFDVLGVKPLIGRNFVPGDNHAGGHVAILSYRSWQRLFAGIPQVLGKTILISDEPYTVIGVMPRGLVEPRDETAEVWTTFAFYFEGSPPQAMMRDEGIAEVVGRLKPDVSQQQAQADLTAVQAELAQSYQEIHYKNAVLVRSKLEEVTGYVRPQLYLLLAAVLAMFLIVCTNVAGLILTRAMKRNGEMALRMALGASHWRIWRQLLAESLFLATWGAALGVGIAWTLLRVALPLIPEDLPRMSEVGLSWRVLFFTVGISLICALISSLFPAWTLIRISPIETIRDFGRATTSGGKWRFQQIMVLIQTTLAVTLLIGAAFLIRGFINLRNANTGFRSDHLFSFMLPLTEQRYPHTTRALFYHELIPKLAAIPGVHSASGGYPLPLFGGYHSVTVELDGRPNPPGHALSTFVGVAEPGFFETLGIPLVRGRLFTKADDDTHSPLVAVVNQAFVKKYFPDENPIGRHIRPDIRGLRNQAKDVDSIGDREREIVGIVADTSQNSLLEPMQPLAVFPFAQASELMRPRLLMRVAGDPTHYEKAAAAAVTEIDPALFLMVPGSMEMLSGQATTTERFETLLISAFSAIALFLTSVGLYSMLANMVMGRTREIGLRMAIGASRSDVAWMVLAQANALLLTGLMAGSGIASVALRILRASTWSHGLLFRVSWFDPRTLLMVVLVFSAVGFTGCLLPTWCAMRIEPLEALRDE
jgi:putative ABC transport system permease protein